MGKCPPGCLFWCACVIVQAPRAGPNPTHREHGLRFRMGVHRLPKDEGSWNRVPRHERICLLCNSGSLCDEKHVVFQCSALQDLRDEYASLFSDACTMKEFLWQDDLVSVAKLFLACLDKIFSCVAGLSNDGQTSDQPDVAGRDVI